MGQPSINIIFKQTAATVTARAARGVVAVIVKDAATLTVRGLTLASAADVPSTLSAANQAYIKQTFLGNDNAPKKVLLYVLASTASDLSDATAWLSTQQFDWLAGPAGCTAADATELAAYVAAQRNDGQYIKAVLPDKAADSEAIVNFTTDGILVAGASSTVDAGAYCSRIAGLIAGTNAVHSATFAVLPEVVSVTALTKADRDTAADAGELIIFHDGEKVKAGRAVTSLTTTTTTPACYKKVKIVDTCDIIRKDIRILADDYYIGKMANSYDNKLLLVTAISDYFAELETEGLLERGGSSVGIDVDACKTYLTAQGVDISALSDQQIKEHDTDDKVFLSANVTILDAMEDITLDIII